MKRSWIALLTCAVVSSACAAGAGLRSSSSGPAWSMNATIIEACTCPMFCQCYFNAEPASHPGCCPPGTDPADAPRYCRFNNAFRVNTGHSGEVKLDGARFWVAGDLGGDFSEGQMDWAVVHFDPAVTEEQRAGILTVLERLYPVKWKSLEVKEDQPIEWKADKDRATAKLGEGKVAEVGLVRNQGMNDDPIVIRNLRYWGAPRNDGFVLMANELQAYRAGAKTWETRGTNGFMITLDITSQDAPAKKAGY